MTHPFPLVSRPLRLLLLSHSPDDENAGASRIYHMLAAGLCERGHEVDLFHLEAMGLPREPHLARLAQRTLMPRYLSRFGARQIGRGYDAVMASSGMAAPLFARLRRARARPLLVNHLHGLAIHDHVAAMSEAMLGHGRASRAARLVTGPLQAQWDARGVSAADLTIVQNRRDLGDLKERCPGAAVELIAPAVHPQVLAASALAPTLDGRAPLLVWFAAWQPRKGCHYLPGAFRIVRAAHPEARLAIGGTGGTPVDLIDRFAAEDRAAIEVLPRISVADQAALFGRAAIVVFPSRSEGFGLALAEAMCFGLAAIAGSTGFAADFLCDGRDGRIVPPSSEHIGRAIVDLLDNPAECSRIAAAGQRIASNLTRDHMISAYEQAFRLGRVLPVPVHQPGAQPADSLLDSSQLTGV